jgi:uncharacterized protein (TIGR02996 family)
LAQALSRNLFENMMDERSFLASIIENPQDDLPRLVCADWLEEYGSPERAELIRIQCKLARKAEFDPSRTPFVERERELLSEHGAEWAKPVASICAEYQFLRGFIDSVVIGARKFLTHGARLFQLAPIRHVRLIRLGSSNVSGNDVAACDFLSHIQSLALDGGGRFDLQPIINH